MAGNPQGMHPRLARARYQERGAADQTLRAKLFAGLGLGLLAIASPIVAGDFRGTALGGSCGGVDTREAALGSQKIPLAPNVLAFKGTAFGREATITYLCQNEMLGAGVYLFPMHDYTEAATDYKAAYAAFLSSFGPPYAIFPTDTATLPSTDADVPKEFSASWRVDDLVIHAHLIPSGDGSKHNWRAQVSVQPPRAAPRVP
jgi:hypothetical protein